MIEHLESIHETEFNKQKQKLENMLESVGKVFDKKLPSNKQKA